MESFLNNFFTFLKGLFVNSKSYIRFMIFLITLSSLVFVAIYCIDKYLGGNLNIKSNENGVAVITGKGILDKKEMFAIFSLPSSTCWFNTGIVVEPNESIFIKASGTIHTSADKVIESAKVDSEPPFDWNDASGRNFVLTNRYRDPYRCNYFILKSNSQKIGNLLAYLKDPFEDDPSKDYPRPNGGSNKIIDVSKNNKIINNSSQPCTLFLTVNDIVFERTDEAKKAYTGVLEETKNEEERLKYNRNLRNWQDIEDNSAWDIFFKDNLGTFLIQIEKVY